MKQYSSWYADNILANRLTVTRDWQDPDTRCKGREVLKGANGLPKIYKTRAEAEHQADALNRGQGA